MPLIAPCGPGRVVVVLHEGGVNGASNSVLRALPGLEERGWSFAFWTPPGELSDRLRDEGRPVAGLPRPVIGYSVQAMRLAPGAGRRVAMLPGYLRELSAFTRKQEAVLVHANTLHTLLEALIGRVAGAAAILHVHEMGPTPTKAQAAMAVAARARIEVVAVSAANAEAYRRNGSLPRVVYESASPVAPVDRDRSSDAPVLVGSVAVLAPRKGPDLFVEAARLVRARDPRIEFHLVGSASDTLEQAWGRAVLAQADNVGVVCHPSADVESALARWDIFVLPSRRDPFPLSVLEAMSSGLPVIGAAVDGLREQITPATGILTAPEDPHALAAAILALAHDPERRSAMGARGRQRVNELFNPSVQAAGLHEAYTAARRRALPPTQ